jgi:hypothetical protein
MTSVADTKLQDSRSTLLQEHKRLLKMFHEGTPLDTMTPEQVKKELERDGDTRAMGH